MKALLSGNEAIARGAYEAGVQVVTGYPGTPSSEIIKAIADQYGPEIYTEWSTNEKVAMDAAAGAAYSGKRTMLTTKQVGMNVLSDALLYTVYTGAEAGLVVVTADDPGLFSSQNEQDNRWYSRLAKIPTFEPADSQEAKDFVKIAFELSEMFDTSVLLRSVMRVSHCKSVVELGERTENPKHLDKFPRHLEKYNCNAIYAKQMHLNVEERIKKIAQYAETMKINHIEWKDRSVGIITSGVVYDYVKDVFPNASILKLGMTYPLPEKMIRSLAEGVDKLLVIEELDPVLEEQISAMGIKVIGKELFPPCFELLPDRLMDIGIAAGLLDKSVKPVEQDVIDKSILPTRSLLFCAGCPHRSTYYNLANKLDVPVTGDIGCYNLGCQEPFRAQHTMGAMGASIGVLHGMSIAGIKERGVCTIGDSTFFHSGLGALTNMVHNEGKGVVIIMDNGNTAMTGHQDSPSTDWKVIHARDARKIEIEPLCRAMGVEMVKTVDAFNVKEVEEGLKECLAFDGPSVLITKGDCVQINKGAKPLYEVDPDKCVGCHLCLKVGCPSIVVSDDEHPKTHKKKCRIDSTLCAGCSICSQVCPAKAIRRKEGK
ncbi:MAG: indolepyruvate ferredoxin oxidoreductase subunit alpha [Clostridia bacterium]